MPSVHAHDAARSEGTYGAVATCKRLSRGGATVLGRQAIASGPRRATAHTVASAGDRAVEIGCDRGEAHVSPAAIGDVEGECAVDPDAQGSVLPIGAFKATSWSISNRRPRGMLPRVAPAGASLNVRRGQNGAIALERERHAPRNARCRAPGRREPPSFAPPTPPRQLQRGSPVALGRMVLVDGCGLARVRHLHRPH